MSANNSMLSNLHLKLSTSGLRFFYYPFYLIGMVLYYTFVGIFASVKWIALSPFKLIMNIPQILGYVYIGLLYFFGGIIAIWFAPALLLKKIGLEGLANVVGVIMLVLGLAFFQYALKPMIGIWIFDFERSETWFYIQENILIHFSK